METIITKTNVYPFNELSEESQQNAIDNNRDMNTDYEWWGCEIDDFKTIAGLMGIEIEGIYFSGFSSQGDGACFTGSYAYKKGSVKGVKAYAPRDEELHRIVEELAKSQKPNFYSLEAQIKHSGHYYHSGCTAITVINTNNDFCYIDGPNQADDIRELLRDFMNWTYKSLESQYGYLTSDEGIKESLISNEYQFTKDGDIFLTKTKNKGLK